MREPQKMTPEQEMPFQERMIDPKFAAVINSMKPIIPGTFDNVRFVPFDAADDGQSA